MLLCDLEPAFLDINEEIFNDVKASKVTELIQKISKCLSTGIVSITDPCILVDLSRRVNQIIHIRHIDIIHHHVGIHSIVKEMHCEDRLDIRLRQHQIGVPPFMGPPSHIPTLIVFSLTEGVQIPERHSNVRD